MIAPLSVSESTGIRGNDGGNRDAGLAAAWSLLTEAGTAIAGLAQIGGVSHAMAPRDFAMRAAAGGPARLLHAERMIDDTAATLHVGLSALSSAIDDRRDVAAAALTLWQEYERARDALTRLVAPIH